MLTIRTIAQNGDEGLFEADAVHFAPHENAQTSDDKVLYVHHNGEISTVESGIVYVMNSNGKTVARYEFQQSYGNRRIKQATEKA